MTWDDNWTRALVTVLAGALGAVIAAGFNVYAANRKIRELEVQYQQKLRDGYLENARKVADQVYIPISIALTSLSNCFGRYAANRESKSNPGAEKAFRDDFETECLRFLHTIEGLLARGADAYLTTTIDERLNDFCNFLRESLDRSYVLKRRTIRAQVNSPLVRLEDYRLSAVAEAKSRLSLVRLPRFKYSVGGFGVDYSEVILGAPIQSDEFELVMKTEVPQIKALVKEVTLGSQAAAS
jgi:hypothetical protein